MSKSRSPSVPVSDVTQDKERRRREWEWERPSSSPSHSSRGRERNFRSQEKDSLNRANGSRTSVRVSLSRERDHRGHIARHSQDCHSLDQFSVRSNELPRERSHSPRGRRSPAPSAVTKFEVPRVRMSSLRG